MAVTQTITFSATPPTIGEAPATFNTNAVACWNDLKNNIVPDLNTAFTQMNALEENVNNKEASAASSASSALNSATLAETAKTLAYASANFAGTWNSATDFQLKSVEYGGIVYVSLQSPNVNHQPDISPTYWLALTQPLPIDETVSHLSITASTYNTDGTLATMTYTGGYKTLYTYTSGLLSTVQYTDTDGTTVLLTETIAYSGGNISTVTRS